MTSGTIEQTVEDDTLPGGPRQKTIVYEAPFDRCNREQDYATVWAEFERRFQKDDDNIIVLAPNERSDDQVIYLNFPIPEDTYVAFEADQAARNTHFLTNEDPFDIEGESGEKLADNVPYASNIGRLRKLIEAGHDNHRGFGEFANWTGRTWYRYLELGRWLGIIRREARNHYLTPFGSSFLSAQEHFPLIKAKIQEVPLIQAVLSDTRWPAHAEDVIKDVLSTQSHLGDTSIDRRTSDVLSLLNQCGLAAQTHIFDHLPKRDSIGVLSEQPELGNPAELEAADIPQANSVAMLIKLLEAMATGIDNVEALAEALSMAGRTVHYYLHLATWLDFAHTPAHSQFNLTELGQRFTAEPQSRHKIFKDAILARDVARTALELADDSTPLFDAVLLRVLATTQLAETTARRRAHALTRLLETMLDSSDTVWGEQAEVNEPNFEEPALANEPIEALDGHEIQPDQDESAEAADFLSRPITLFDPPGLITNLLDELEVITVKDLLALNLNQVRGLRGVGPGRVDVLATFIEGLRQKAGDDTPGEAGRNLDLDDLLLASITVLNPPDLIVNTLRELGVETLGDLVDLDLSNARDFPEVDPTRIQAIRECIAGAHDLCAQHNGPGGEGPVVSRLGERLIHSGIDLTTPVTRLQHLLPVRICNQFETVRVATIGDLANRYEDGSFQVIRGIGVASIRKVGEFFAYMIEEGIEVVRFGLEGRPTSVPDLVTRATATLDERDQEVIHRRFIDGHILEDIGEDLDLTRERVRQLEADAINAMQLRFGDIANDLVTSVAAALEGSAGLLHMSFLPQFTRETNPLRLVIAFHIAGHTEAGVWADEWLTLLENDERDELLAKFKSALMDLGDVRVELADAMGCATELGLMVDRQTTRRLLAAAFKIDALHDAFIIPWMSLADVLAELARSMGRPGSTQDFRAAYERKREETELALPDLNDHNLRSGLQRAEGVYNYAHGVYVHVDNFPMVHEEFDRAVSWAFEWLRGRTDQISTETIIEEMKYQRIVPPGLTPHLLKSGLQENPAIISFANTLLVAFAASYIDAGESMLDRLEQALMNAGRPLTLREVMKAIAHYSYSKNSVGQTLLETPFALLVGRSTFLHRNHAGLTELQMEDLLDELDNLLDTEGTAESANSLLERLTGPAATILRDMDQGPKLLWALARSDERYVGGAGLLLARNTGEGGRSLFRLAIIEALDDLGIAAPHEVRAWMQDAMGYEGPGGAVNTSMVHLYDQGKVGKLPGALYYIADEDKETVLARWARRPDMIIEVAESPELINISASIRNEIIGLAERIINCGEL